jgi:hypothetical protein
MCAGGTQSRQLTEEQRKEIARQTLLNERDVAIATYNGLELAIIERRLKELDGDDVD